MNECLCQAEQALEKQDFAAILSYASKLEARASSPEVYAFFKKLTRAILCAPGGQHVRLFAHCLNAVCAYDQTEGAAFLENMLSLTVKVECAVTAPAGILH